MKQKQKVLTLLLFLSTIFMTNCKTGGTPAESEGSQSLAPQRVDIRGGIISSQYGEGQVVLEVEGFATTPDSRYNRAYVLVLPTTQITGPKGQSLSLSELRMGQNVAILLRGGGEGNRVGLGVARRVWIEDIF
ncbi:hypothetical protein ACFSRY_00160 [Pontibacter locisalis]|uniref:DUF5666 domain-containing protein n=1 Tax=Pontibacter locisalis TaxID=1719035 RepID=A0ABW5IF70_9BACT